MADQLRLNEHQTLRILASGPERLELESTWAPGGTPPRTHWHPSQHEHFEVLGGELTVEVDGQPARTLGVGESLQVPPRTAHRMWNAGPVVTRASWRVTPAQRTEQMFRTIAGGLNPVSAVLLLWRHRGEMRLGSPRTSRGRTET
ncbi:MAG TPA: cupin domain-containing protein [Microlunatus sp.]|nr:cupin domain-containing protein [Microlunatus sp.]